MDGVRKMCCHCSTGDPDFERWHVAQDIEVVSNAVFPGGIGGYCG